EVQRRRADRPREPALQGARPPRRGRLARASARARSRRAAPAPDAARAVRSSRGDRPGTRGLAGVDRRGEEGRGEAGRGEAGVTPRAFTIKVPDEVLADLRARLERVRWPDEPPDAGWRYGASVAYMKELVEHWRARYDWRAHEARLNRLRQFTVELGGIELHFIHEPGVRRA